MSTIHEVDREDVMAFLDGELSDDRAAAVRAHLDRCPECKALAEDLRRVSARLSTWQVDHPSDALVMSTRVPLAGAVAALRSPRSGFGAHVTLSRWWVAVAAGLLIGVVTVGKYLGRSALGVAGAPMTSAADMTYNDRLALPRGELETNGALKKSSNAPDAFQGIDVVTSGGDAAKEFPLAQAVAKESRMIARAVTLSLSTDKFDDMRAAIERVAAAHQGRIASLSASGDPPTHRSLSATVLVPVAETDAAVSSLRSLGTVVQESQSSEDITDSHRDLAIRLANAKVEEGRLGELLARGTDKLTDVLAVEQAQSRVRGEIEQMTAEEQAMAGRAALSTITVQVGERYHAEITLGPVTLSTRFHNALVDGLRGAVDTIIDASLAVVGAAPAVGLWGLLLFWPTRWAWRRIRQHRAS